MYTNLLIQVQPLPELSELSRRYRNDGTTIELDDTNIKCGTLRRSGSKRFKQSKVGFLDTCNLSLYGELCKTQQNCMLFPDSVC